MNYYNYSPNSNNMKKIADEYKKFSSQTTPLTSLLRDKGEGMLTVGEKQKNTTTSLLSGNYSPYKPPSLTGDGIKKHMQSVYANKEPAGNKNLFDDIDSKAIEKNVPVAKDAIQKNMAATPLNSNLLEKYPYLTEGLAMFYAAAEAGNHNAAKQARKIAYTEDVGLGLADGISPQAQTTESNKRYVNADIGLNVRSEAGTSNSIIGKLKKDDEVEFTGNKKPDSKGDAWAEIKYGDKTGWVVADCLNLKKPEATSENVPQSENNGGTRYVGEKTISMRAVPGFRSHTKATIDYGQSVEFTGKKKPVDGIEWAEVKYGNKTGWVIADHLKTQRSPDMPYGVDLTDHDSFQKAFDEITEGFSAERLQCVFLTKWFLNNYTTLKTGNGDGFMQVEVTKKANQDKLLQESIIPSAPAIYSMDKGKPGFGMRDLTDSGSGHTGVILNVKSNNESENPLECTYDIVYFDTYSKLYDDKHRSRLKEVKGVKPVEHITYLNVGEYLK